MDDHRDINEDHDIVRFIEDLSLALEAARASDKSTERLEEMRDVYRYIVERWPDFARELEELTRE